MYVESPNAIRREPNSRECLRPIGQWAAQASDPAFISDSLECDRGCTMTTKLTSSLPTASQRPVASARKRDKVAGQVTAKRVAKHAHFTTSTKCAFAFAFANSSEVKSLIANAARNEAAHQQQQAISTARLNVRVIRCEQCAPMLTKCSVARLKHSAGSSGSRSASTAKARLPGCKTTTIQLTSTAGWTRFLTAL